MSASTRPGCWTKCGANIIGVGERNGGIFDESGIDIAAAGMYYRERGELTDYPHGDAITNEELLTCDCDILIPAAMENTLTEDVAPHIKAKIVVEAPMGRRRRRRMKFSGIMG